MRLDIKHSRSSAEEGSFPAYTFAHRAIIGHLATRSMACLPHHPNFVAQPSVTNPHHIRESMACRSDAAAGVQKGPSLAGITEYTYPMASAFCFYRFRQQHDHRECGVSRRIKA
jgi:hypothetical protein